MIRKQNGWHFQDGCWASEEFKLVVIIYHILCFLIYCMLYLLLLSKQRWCPRWLPIKLKSKPAQMTLGQVHPQRALRGVLLVVFSVRLSAEHDRDIIQSWWCSRVMFVAHVKKSWDKFWQLPQQLRHFVGFVTHILDTIFVNDVVWW